MERQNANLKFSKKYHSLGSIAGSVVVEVTIDYKTRTFHLSYDNPHVLNCSTKDSLNRTRAFIELLSEVSDFAAREVGFLPPEVVSSSQS